jgi:hypothetical protein
LATGLLRSGQEALNGLVSGYHGDSLGHYGFDAARAVTGLECVELAAELVSSAQYQKVSFSASTLPR